MRMRFLSTHNWLKSIKSRKRIQRKDAEVGLSTCPGFHRLNKLVDPGDWDNKGWLKVHQELASYSVDKHCFSKTKELAYRKGWEWTQALYGLHCLGMITSHARGIGVGAGHEPLLFYLTDYISEVVGADLYGNEEWASVHGKEGSAAVLEDATAFCARKFVPSKLRLYKMNGTALSFKDGSFDFAWSLSSIEHFGGHEAARKSIQEMARVTRPGGVVVVATELILTPGVLDHPEYFTKHTFQTFVLNASPSLAPIEPMSFELPGL